MPKRLTHPYPGARECRPSEARCTASRHPATAPWLEHARRHPIRWPAVVACALLLLAGPPPVLAHKVVTAGWVEGSEIVGEVGLSNGEMAEEGTRVEAFGPDGTRLGETVTDADGLFRFTPTEPVSHRFEINLGAGHLGEVVVPAEELPIGLGLERPEEPGRNGLPRASTASATAAGATGPEAALATGASPAELELLIARAVQRQVLPLRRELAAYKETQDLQGILGGIGYICGIFGLLFFIYARRGARAGVATTDRGR